MSTFERLFGIPENEIQRTCVLLPLLTKDLLKDFGLQKLSKGKLFSSGNADDFTLIRTGVGPAFLGDAVLHLGELPCENLILFGSCGLVSKKDAMDIGSFALPHTCYSLESFSTFLNGKCVDLHGTFPDKKLYELFCSLIPDHELHEISCATVGSLKLQPDNKPLFEQLGIQIVDMECSALFNAAQYCQKKAVAFFYVNDIITEKFFYDTHSPYDTKILQKSLKKAVAIVRTVCEKLALQ